MKTSFDLETLARARVHERLAEAARDSLADEAVRASRPRRRTGVSLVQSIWQFVTAWLPTI